MDDESVKPFSQQITRRQERLEAVTLRDFSGGENVIDNDLNLRPRFSKRMWNVVRAPDGTVSVRYGTRLFTELPADKGILDLIYFSNAIIAPCHDGTIYKILGDGTTLEIWSNTVAATLPGTPTGWGECDFVSYAKFRGDLIICNGVDKPLIIDADFFVDYLHDLATGSNVNTPICRYVIATPRYVVMAGNPEFPGRVHISNIDTSGTWKDDPNPNDAIEIDLDTRVTSGDTTIKTVAWFRDLLIVGFEECFLLTKLGVYVSSVHTPTFDETIDQTGAISHRSSLNFSNDMLFCDGIGVPSLTQAVFRSTVDPERASQLIDPAIQSVLQRIRLPATLEDHVFALHNRLDYEYMLFIPTSDVSHQATTGVADPLIERRAFVFKKIDQLKVNAWYEFRNWFWHGGCRTALNRLLFARKNQIYIYGSANDPIYADYVGDQETFSDGTAFSDHTGWTPIVADVGSGIPIEWLWELPWVDHGRRGNVKKSKYIQIETTGTDKFTCEMFVDGIFRDPRSNGDSWSDDTLFSDDTGWDDTDDPVTSPALSLEFDGGDAPGFGVDPFGRKYSGRPTKEERLYSWPASYKISKLRFRGDSLGPLNFVSITTYLLKGSIRRGQ